MTRKLRSELLVSSERSVGGEAFVLIQTPEGGLTRWRESDWRRLLAADGCQGLFQSQAQVRPLLPVLPEDATGAKRLKQLTRRAERSGLFQTGDALQTDSVQVDAPGVAFSRAPDKPLTLPEARYHCYQCGESCRAGYEVGPLPEPPVLDKALTVPMLDGAHLPHLEGTCTQLVTLPGSPPKDGCRIHAEHGWQRKPLACWEFPILLARTPLGTRAYLQWECTRLHRSLVEGPALSESLPESVHGRGVWQAPTVVARQGGRLVSFERYALLEGDLLRRVSDCAAVDDLDRLMLGLPYAVEMLQSWPADEASFQVAFEPLLPSQQVSVESLLDDFLLDQAPFWHELRLQGLRLTKQARWLSKNDRRRLYRGFLQQVLNRWEKREEGTVTGGLPKTAQLPLLKAWVRNRLFGLELLRAPTLELASVTLSLRYALIRESFGVRPSKTLTEVWTRTGDDASGHAEQRRMVALDHGLREERLEKAWQARMAEGGWSV